MYEKLDVLFPRFDQQLITQVDGDICSRRSPVVGLIPVIVQEISTDKVLMFGWTNQHGYVSTLSTGFAFYFSFEKNELYGHPNQRVYQILINHALTALIYRVSQHGEPSVDCGSIFQRDIRDISRPTHSAAEVCHSNLEVHPDISRQPKKY